MIAFVYTRIVSAHRVVPLSERHPSQEHRCKEFLRRHHIKHLRTYSDYGQMHPIHLPHNFRRMLDALRHKDGVKFIIADHPQRLGNEQGIQDAIIKKINEAGAEFIWPKPTKSYNSFTANFIKELENLEPRGGS